MNKPAKITVSIIIVLLTIIIGLVVAMYIYAGPARENMGVLPGPDDSLLIEENGEVKIK